MNEHVTFYTQSRKARGRPATVCVKICVRQVLMKPSIQLLTIAQRINLAYEIQVYISLNPILGEEEWSKDSVSLKGT
jgi:hypothetical protein